MGKTYGIVRKIYIPVSSAHDLISSKKMYFIIDINNNLNRYETKMTRIHRTIKINDTVRVTTKIIDNCIDVKIVKSKWCINYELAKIYYERYDNLEIPVNFKTNDGYSYDENGIPLGRWISTQRRAHKNNQLSPDRIELLNKIGMRFETNYDDIGWNKHYELAKFFYEHYGNLEIVCWFKTNNGYSYDENGIALGEWVSRQRQAYRNDKLLLDKIELLNKIGMRFEANYVDIEWNKHYELAKIYYEHHGDLEILQRFKTSNGYSYDENGIALGTWINTQRQAYKSGKLSLDKIELLNKIGMRFLARSNDDGWNKKYELAKNYYEHHGDLDIIYWFKTNNGYSYYENGTALGTWINAQRQTYRSQQLSLDKIELLNKIGMIWMTVNIDEKLQSEIIDDKNINRKKIEIYNRFLNYLSKVNSATYSKEKFNQDFIDELDKVKKYKK